MLDSEFKAMIRRARRIEWEVCTWYRKNVDSAAKLALPKTREYDIIVPKVNNVEVKEDRIASKSGRFVFEMEDRNGKPSGLAATTAGEFVLLDDLYIYRMKTASVLFLIKECHERRLIQMGETTREGKRGWGYIIPADRIIHSAYVETIRRWFQ